MQKHFLAAAVGLIAILASTHTQAQTSVTVSPIDMKGWVFFDDGAFTPCFANNVCAIESGPQTPPAGMGSARLALVGSSDRPSLGARLDSLAGVRLADITVLTYSTFIATNQNVQAIALQFPVDNDVTDLDYAYRGRLVFEPYHEPSLGPVQTGVWQTWNTLNGKWWLSSAGNPDRLPNAACSQSAPCTVTELLAHYPNIGVRDVPAEPNVILKAGSGWVDFDGNVDALTIGTLGSVSTTYNFEVGPTNKEACYNNGWVDFFRNQGQCVSRFVN